MTRYSQQREFGPRLRPRLLLAAFFVGLAFTAISSEVGPQALSWDAESKDYDAKPTDIKATFAFSVKNVSDASVRITGLRTSCGCTVAQLPPLPGSPFILGPGSSTSIEVTMDLRGKTGLVTKGVIVESSVGVKSLLVRASIPAPLPITTTLDTAHTDPPFNPMGDRAKKIEQALADPQSVFKGDCAKCHVDRGVGKMGKELYLADCALCHDAEIRAAMVPDLRMPRSSRDLAFWNKWISEGKSGTLMPAFSPYYGGPLTYEQIDSLVAYLYANYPRNAADVFAK